jgi:hypothetical protein
MVHIVDWTSLVLAKDIESFEPTTLLARNECIGSMKKKGQALAFFGPLLGFGLLPL